MLIIILSYLLPVLGLLSIGTITIMKNSHRRVNLLFFMLTITISLWLLALLVADLALSPSISLWAIRLATSVGTLMAPLIIYFANAFPVRMNRISRAIRLFAIVPSAIFALLAMSPFLIPGVELKVHSVQPVDLGVLYTLQSIYLISCFALGFLIMYRKLKHGTSSTRSQIKLVITGLAFALLINIATGLFLQLLNQANNFSDLAGALSLLVFLCATSYAIIKYRLFDVRLAITRVIGYSVTLGLVAAFYSLVVVLFSSKFTFVGDINLKELIILLIPTFFIALTFQRVERFVSKHTQSIFYQDAYNLREVLDQLSDALLVENDIDNIMQQSMDVLTQALKPSSSFLAVLNKSGIIYKQIFFGFEGCPPDAMPLLNRLPETKQALIDWQEEPNSAISKILAKENIEILLRLGTRRNPVGVLLLGTKHNGTMYNKQDVSLLKISAKNLGIALDNAKKYEQILHFADTMHKEVKRATSRLRKANEELKTLDALKDDFIAVASHQLRTPAASVHDALRMLNHPQMTKSDRDELINLAEASSENLVMVVRTMLNMARLQAGHFTIDKSETDLIELSEKVISQVKVLADQKYSKITFSVPDHPVIMPVDTAKINEALSNYIENAIKYSPEHSTITVNLMDQGDKVDFEVTDQGMGVPEAERANLFGKFYRATNARLEQPDGNGIGLYVVRSIAEGHEGGAYYRPADETGSVFGFWLPKNQIKK